MMITHKVLRRTTASMLVATMILAACGGDKPEKYLASAKEYLAKNDTKAAVIEIKNALQKNPDMAEARFLLGKALLENGDAVAAAVELNKAVNLKFPADQVTPLLAKSMLAQGEFKKVVESFAKTKLATSEDNANLQTTVALAQMAMGDVEAAHTALAAALASQPEYTPALMVDARIKATQKDFAGALTVLDALTAKASANSDAWKLKGDILNVKGDAESAIAAYRKALEIKPDSIAAHAELVSTLMRQAKLDDAAKQLDVLKKVAPKSPQTLFLNAQLAYQKKDFKAARETAQQLAGAMPDNPYVLQLAGLIELQLNSLASAENYLEKTLKAAPKLDLARRALTMTYLRSGQMDKAMSTIEPVLASIDKDPEMLALAGQVFIESGNAQKGEEYFVKASALDPKDARKRTSVAVAHLLEGQTDTAYRELEQISATDTGVTADLALISSSLQRKDFDRALQNIAALEKKQPNNPMVYNLRGNTLLSKGDVAEARKSFGQALSVNAAYFPAAAALARLDLGDKKPDDAKKRFESVLAADAKNTQALIALAELSAKTGGKLEDIAALVNKAITQNPTEAVPRVVLTDLYLSNKEPKKALEAAQNAIAALPDNPLVLDALGRAQAASGDYNQALTTFGKLASAQANSPQPYMRMAEVNLAAKSKDEAAKSFRKALSVKPDFIDAQRALMALAVEAGKDQEALSIVQDVQKQRPKEAIGYMLEGDFAAFRKSWKNAIAAFRNGLNQAPSTDLAVRMHSSLQVGEGQPEADKFALAWLKDHPKDGAFRFYLAESASKRKDYPTAISYYRGLLEIQPDNVLVLNNLAWVAGQQKDAKAIEYAEKANKLAPNQPNFMDTLAMLLLDKGDTARALELSKKATELSKNNPEIRLNFAKVLIKANNKTEARKELDELAKLGDKFPAQAEVAQLMKAL